CPSDYFNHSPGYNRGGGKKYFPPHIQKIFSWVGKAISQFQMVENGDRIVVGVSGVDSLSVLWVLRERLRWVSIKYEILPIYIDLGFNGDLNKQITDYLKSEAYDFKTLNTDVGIRSHSSANRKNPCFFCSRERKKILFNFARENNCNKIVLGHHIEDINATLFLNIIYGSSISTMLPRQDFFGGKLTIIRPFALVSKVQIQKLADSVGMPPLVNPCPSALNSQRYQINRFLDYFYKKDRRIRYNIFRALKNINKDYLPK
ncbi:MAG: tRNA 2-thiocytidine biosynthesis TtcA family protein, partial [Desulfobacterota bacterium]|nr:tRNA 2-thiocytidine biosynthesis TtcA family protein [Thermodesulfobacteriota bacterium]